MADWRMMGSAMRRRMGAPSHHGGGAETLRVFHDKQPGPGRPREEGPDFWERAREQDEEVASWAKRVSENHPSNPQKRMRPEDRYFG